MMEIDELTKDVMMMMGRAPASEWFGFPVGAGEDELAGLGNSGPLGRPCRGDQLLLVRLPHPRATQGSPPPDFTTLAPTEKPSHSHRRKRMGILLRVPSRTLMMLLTLLLLLLSACANNDVASPTPANNTITGKSKQVLTSSVSAIGNFAEYALPQKGSGLMRPAIDRRGRLWFGEMSRNYLAMFDPRTRQFEQMKPPHGAFGIMGIAVAADDTIWFAEQNANYIGHYDPATQHFTQYGLPNFKIPDPANSNNTLTLPSAPNDLVIDAHGNIWFTELNADAIGMLDSHTGKIRQYPLDAQKSIQKLNPYGITLDAQGDVWFTEASNSQLGQLHPVTGQIDYFRTPDPTNPLMEIAADAQGHIWATAFNAGQLVMFDPSTKSYSVYHAPGASGSAGGLYGLTVTTDGEVWLTISTENAIARFDIQAHRFVYYAIPSPNSLPLGIVAGLSDHSFWFTEAGTDKIGILQVR